MITAGEITLQVYADAAFPENDLQILDGNDDPINLSGMTFRFTVRLRDDAPGDPLINIVSGPTSGNRIQIVDASLGKIRLHISEATLAALPRGAPDTNGFTLLRWQLQYTVSGVDYRMAFGDFNIRGII